MSYWYRRKEHETMNATRNPMCSEPKNQSHLRKHEKKLLRRRRRSNRRRLISTSSCSLRFSLSFPIKLSQVHGRLSSSNDRCNIFSNNRTQRDINDMYQATILDHGDEMTLHTNMFSNGWYWDFLKSRMFWRVLAAHANDLLILRPIL